MRRWPAVGALTLACVAGGLAYRAAVRDVAPMPASTPTLPAAVDAAPAIAAAARATTSARALYESQPHRAAVFRALADQPDASSQYFAYRAASDCVPVLGPATDWNDLRFELAATLLSTAHDRATDAARRRAIETLRAACAGFTRPATLPRERLPALRAAAAAAGHPAAVAAQRWDDLQRGQPPITAAHLRDLAEAAFASGDPYALRESEGGVLSLRHATPVGGLGARDLEVLVAALRLVDCHVQRDCGGAGLLAAAECAVRARCDLQMAADPVGQILHTLDPAQRAAAQRAAQVLRDALARRSLAVALAPLTPR